MLSRFAYYFDEVAKQGSIRQASEKLHIAPSAIDRQILQVEERLGAKLFERRSKGLMLTPAGALMVEAVRRWRQEVVALEMQITDLQEARTGEVRVAADESALEFLSKALARFQQAHPHIVHRIKVAGSAEVSDMLRTGEATIGLLFNPLADNALRIERTLIYRIGAVMAPTHPLAHRNSLSANDCAECGLIIPDENSASRPAIDMILNAQKDRVRIASVANSNQSIKSLAKAGIGIGLMTVLDAAAEVEAGDLVYRPLTDDEIPFSVFAIAVSASQALSGAAAKLLAHLNEAMASTAHMRLLA